MPAGLVWTPEHGGFVLTSEGWNVSAHAHTKLFLTFLGQRQTEVTGIVKGGAQVTLEPRCCSRCRRVQQ